MKTVGVNGKNKRFRARIVSYHPDWDYRMKYRGYALLLIGPEFAAYPYMLVNDWSFKCGVINANEVFLNSKDNAQLKSDSHQHHGGGPIIFIPLVYEAWLLMSNIETAIFRNRFGDKEKQKRLEKVLHKSAARLWRRVLKEWSETAVSEEVEK